MLRSALIYGSLAGITMISVMIIGHQMDDGSQTGVSSSEAVGYLIMLLASSFIFFGVKRFRDIEQGGVIKFTKALGLGAMMAAVATVCYVAIWEVYLALTDYAFFDQYFDSLVAAKQAEGMAGAELDAWVAENEGWKTMLQNPFLRIPITMTEFFPIGLIVALITAAILRKPEVLPAHAR